MKVLIATDGSEFSDYAIKEFCRIFPDRSRFQIKVVSACEEQYMLAAEPFYIPGEYEHELAETLKTQAGNSVASAAEAIRNGDGGSNVTTELLQGPPEKEIVKLAELWGADLIVVGSHGRGFLGRMLGSVSDAVVHHAPCSVMVVRTPKG